MGNGSPPQLSTGPTPRDSDLIELRRGLGTQIFQSSLESFVFVLFF